MISQASQRGEGKLGFILTLAVVGLVAFLGFKVIPVRVTAYEFKDSMREEARLAAVRKSDAAVAKRLLKKAEELDIPLEAKNLIVRRTSGEVIITVNYEQPIDLKLTTYVYRFKQTEKAPLF